MLVCFQLADACQFRGPIQKPRVDLSGVHKREKRAPFVVKLKRVTELNPIAQFLVTWVMIGTTFEEGANRLDFPV